VKNEFQRQRIVNVKDEDCGFVGGTPGDWKRGDPDIHCGYDCIGHGDRLETEHFRDDLAQEHV
jgi:hypothetical protein